MSYQLDEAIRLAESALRGSPWTGKLEKRDVDYVVRKLIAEARHINRENAELRRKVK